jgi:hypothetical protein
MKRLRMTKRASHTEAQIRRNIKAALRVGLRIAGIGPDGTVLVRDGDDLVPSPALARLDDSPAVPSKWSDVEA